MKCNLLKASVNILRNALEQVFWSLQQNTVLFHFPFIAHCVMIYYITYLIVNFPITVPCAVCLNALFEVPLDKSVRQMTTFASHCKLMLITDY
uniref:Uncharacterized protein n=1 Tax=Anguilla anguilla TaxID=7936 RepID=A0A0E9QMZ6_ANGAN